MTDFVPAQASVQVDNERVRVTRYSFPPQGETGWHTHEYPYVIVPVIGGALTMIDAEGRHIRAEIQAGLSYFREAGVSHNVVNLTDHPIEFVETELKG